MINYNNYDNTLTGEAGYPYGKAKNASGPAQVDGTPMLEQYFNDTIGWMQAFMIEAGITPSDVSETSLASDILDATKFIAGVAAGGYESDTSDIAYTTEPNVKMKTLVCQTGCSTVTLTKGVDTNESNFIRIINDSGSKVDVTDGSNPFTLQTGEMHEFYFRGSNLLKTDNETIEAAVDTTIVPSLGIREMTILASGSAETITIDASIGVYFYLVIRIINVTGNELIVEDQGPVSTYYIPPSNETLLTIIGTRIAKLTPNVNYNTGIIDPREKFGGEWSAINPTQNTGYDILSPFLPNIGDEMGVSGLRVSGGNDYITNRAIRSAANTIQLWSIATGTGAITGTNLVDGSSTTIGNISISW